MADQERLKWRAIRPSRVQHILLNQPHFFLLHKFLENIKIANLAKFATENTERMRKFALGPNVHLPRLFASFEKSYMG